MGGLFQLHLNRILASAQTGPNGPVIYVAQAQFQLADAELSQRLWQDVADRDLDVDRILNLLYGCWFQDDPAAMHAADAEFQSRRERELIPGVFEHC